MQALTWFYVIRHGGMEARWAAVLLGSWFLLLIVIEALRASIGLRFHVPQTVVLGYGALSHLAYGVFGSRVRF